jgi:DNA-3-methyladenine glycosidase
MYLIFSLGREDILSKSDGTIKRTIKWMYDLPELPTSQDIKIYFEKWKGYETITSTFLWKSIELDLVKNEFSKIIQFR